MRCLFLCSVWEKTECSTNEESSLKHDCSQAEKGQPNTDNQQVPEELRPDISNGLTWPGKRWSPQCTEISDGSSLLDHLSVCKIKLVRSAPRHVQLRSNEPTVWHRDIKWHCTKDDNLIKPTQGHTPRTKPWKDLIKVQVPVFPLLSAKTKSWADGVSDKCGLIRLLRLQCDLTERCTNSASVEDAVAPSAVSLSKNPPPPPHTYLKTQSNIYCTQTASPVIHSWRLHCSSSSLQLSPRSKTRVIPTHHLNIKGNQWAAFQTVPPNPQTIRKFGRFQQQISVA